MVTQLAVIDAEGHVTAAEVSGGAGNGFDEAALAAAKRFIFKPALRGDRPVRSRIVYRYHFELKARPTEVQPIQKVRLAGRVLSADTDQPIVAAHARFFRGDALIAERETDEQGRFELMLDEINFSYVCLSGPANSELSLIRCRRRVRS